MLKKFLIILLISIPIEIFSQYIGRYVVIFTDKRNNGFSIENPSKFLSERSIQRREKQNIPISFTDLPISQQYVDLLISAGIPVTNRSKWFNSVTTGYLDSTQVQFVSELPFVKEIKLVKPYNHSVIAVSANQTYNSPASRATLNYGFSSRQITIHYGEKLHKMGFTGEGIHIAIIDAGFSNVNSNPAFNNLWSKGKILGTKDFVDPSSDIFIAHSHGAVVLSVIAGYINDAFMGTAPDASFWLLRSEDTGSEYPIEEYNWASAAEFADSAGADIINTSLGYSEFDDRSLNHSYSDMDGNTTPIAVAADLASSKGMLVVVSAGNLGEREWKFISSPADADSVLAVGSIDLEGNISPFSSRGPSSDGDVKPNIAAVGGGTFVIRPTGEISQSNGTSLSAPLISGLAACLWQANPLASNMEIKKALEESSSLYNNPDSSYGYGIPDFYKAHILLMMKSKIDNGQTNIIEFFPNPFTYYPVLAFISNSAGTGIISLYDLEGCLIRKFTLPVTNGLNLPELRDLADISPGSYILHLKCGSVNFKKKIIKF